MLNFKRPPLGKLFLRKAVWIYVEGGVCQPSAQMASCVFYVLLYGGRLSQRFDRLVRVINEHQWVGY